MSSLKTRIAQVENADPHLADLMDEVLARITELEKRSAIKTRRIKKLEYLIEKFVGAARPDGSSAQTRIARVEQVLEAIDKKSWRLMMDNIRARRKA